MKIASKDVRFLFYGAMASFGTYFCMYAFRKPFSVALFEHMSFLGIDYKIVLIITQVLGYMISKFIGIKLISELKSDHRFWHLIGMIGLAELSLLFFGWISAPYNVIFMFANGLSLGMVWGIVFSYLEGRKFTEILGVALCSSFIVSSGAVKSVGLMVMDRLHVSELWMPAVTGAIFLVPFVFFATLLEKMPQPSQLDIALKTERLPMDRQARWRVFQSFMFPIIILVIFYLVLTALRDFRDNFSREIWDAIGFKDNISIYTLSEIPIAIFVLLIMGSMSFVKDNSKAFKYYHILLILGTLTLGLGTILYEMKWISALPWMVIAGFGLYICYVPFNGLFFDRMIATFRINGNVGFLIYIADAFGYLGSISVLLYKNFGQGTLTWLQFFIDGIYVVAILGFGVSVASLLHFQRKYKKTMMPSENKMNIIEL